MFGTHVANQHSPFGGPVSLPTDTSTWIDRMDVVFTTAGGVTFDDLNTHGVDVVRERRWEDDDRMLCNL